MNLVFKKGDKVIVNWPGCAMHGALASIVGPSEMGAKVCVIELDDGYAPVEAYKLSYLYSPIAMLEEIL